MALISTTSGNKSNEWASLAKGGVRGRPGINPLRVHFRYVLEREAAEQRPEKWPTSSSWRITSTSRTASAETRRRLSKNFGTEMEVDGEAGLIRF